MEIKRCSLYQRVSTEKQAKLEEGSLKNQEQMLRDYVRMKSSSTKQKWVIVDTYVDRGISAKNTNRPEYLRMMSDIQDGKINAVLCVALSRISRSTRDLLDMVDYFNKNKVDFVCLKEQFDTTTSQGKCFLTIMGALNQFEREQCSERTISGLYARAQRGLFNGGVPLLGYDEDKNKKGYLIPNKKEAKVVSFLFDTYLENGSVVRTAIIANKKGYLSKEYTSRRDRYHPAKKFCYSSILKILSNKAYIGMKEINKKRKAEKQESLPEKMRYSTCKAVWPAIIDESKFQKTQQLLKENYKHRNNGAKPTKHTYIFNGVLCCHQCGARMEGRNGHGKSGKVYYYYYCTNDECKFKVPERELELAVQRLTQSAVSTPLMLHKITEKLNEKFSRQLPSLKEQKRVFAVELESVNAKAKKVMDNLMNIDKGRTFVEQKLSELDDRRRKMMDNIDHLNREINAVKVQSLEEGDVKRLLGSFDEIFKDHLKLYQKRFILNWILQHIKIGNDKVQVGIVSKRFRSDITQVLRGDIVPEVSSGSHE
ncbi:MAG: recombinase family protein [Candidatus Omnitrophica bacterium]|nr:recombinase family protein [Candidatus Omnitrophota bacterium]